eukprot:6051453-Prymnesium_polylepis.1
MTPLSIESASLHGRSCAAEQLGISRRGLFGLADPPVRLRFGEGNEAVAPRHSPLVRARYGDELTSQAAIAYVHAA